MKKQPEVTRSGHWTLDGIERLRRASPGGDRAAGAHGRPGAGADRPRYPPSPSAWRW